MTINTFLRLSPVLLALTLISCFNPVDPPADAPTNVTATDGENRVVINWDVVDGLTYWLYYKEGTTVSQSDRDQSRYNVRPPFIVTSLINDTQYAFSITASQSSSPVGPFSDVAVATPRLLNPAVAWDVGTSLSINNLNDIAYAGNLYVSVGDAATVFVAPYEYTSNGGVTAWSQVTTLSIDASVNLSAVLFDGIRFVALGEDGTFISSTDTLTWESGIAIITPSTMHSVAVGAGLYVAVGDGGAIYTTVADGATSDWTEQTAVTSNDLYSVSFVADRFIAVGALGTLLTSTDGINWDVQTSNTSSTLRQAVFGADLYVAVGDAGAIVSSTDGVSWTAQSITITESFRDVVFGIDAQFIAVGTTGLIAYSLTGLDGSWQESNAGSIDLNSIVSNLVFIASGDAGANVSAK